MPPRFGLGPVVSVSHTAQKHFPSVALPGGAKEGPSSGRIVSPVEGGYSVLTVARYFTATNPAGEAGIFRPLRLVPD